MFKIFSNLTGPVFLLCACSVVGSCSFFQDPPAPTRLELAKKRALQPSLVETQAEKDRATAVLQQALTATPQLAISFGLELSWEIPQEPVDNFIIYLGDKPEQLSTEIRVPPSKLEVIAGNRYRYVVKPVEQNTSLYFAIAAQKDQFVSDRTEVQQVNPIALP